MPAMKFVEREHLISLAFKGIIPVNGPYNSTKIYNTPYSLVITIIWLAKTLGTLFVVDLAYLRAIRTNIFFQTGTGCAPFYQSITRDPEHYWKVVWVIYAMCTWR